ncbi:hypothetical protein FRC0534_01089 [Corynebacterium diphtheriae]|nr:hypothetical protein FRC0534_01089 [Corynebacterium diphtheriae]
MKIKDLPSLRGKISSQYHAYDPALAMPTPSGFMWIDEESPAVKSIITGEIAPIRAIGWKL